MTLRTATNSHPLNEPLPSGDDLTGARPGPLVDASEAIAQSRRVRAEAADELAAWATILHQAA